MLLVRTIENSFVSNASAFKYEVLPLGKNVRTVIFQASASADLRLAVGESRNLNNEADEDGTAPPAGSSYHLVLGGEDNAYSWVSKQMNSEPASRRSRKANDRRSVSAQA